MGRKLLFMSNLIGCASIVTAAGLLAGCAEERPPINRVQANAMAKSFFVGALADPADDPEFYYRTTVVDAAAGAGNDGLFTSSDAQPTMRVRWEITEKMLVGRLTYELVNGTDFKGKRRTPDGQVVVAFEINKQFDIRRDYNQQTGEEMNVITENETDRPWYERDFMRVDFSKNLVADAYDFDALSQLGIYYGVKFEPMSYYVNDPSNPDVPVFDGPNGYFDLTTKVYAAPQVIHDAEWGDFPACWLVGDFPTTSCNPSEVTLRLSFKRVVDTDYEPIHWDGTRQDMFGWFTVDRFGYDRRYGVVDDKWNRFAARWNLYEKSHADPVVKCATADTTPIGKSAHRDENTDGTEDECAAVGRGSRCDEFRGECTIPMRDRKVKTIAWYVNKDAATDLFEGSAAALEGWSEAIRVALVGARVAECRRTQGTNCEGEMGWPVPWSDDYTPPLGSDKPGAVPKIFVLCHNPVDAALDDLAACGAAGTSPRLGDLRYNFMNVVQSPQMTSPWGIMVDAEDPLTGEKIAGSVNEWGAVLDRAASNLVDLLGLINGTLDPNEYVQGKNVSDWVAANQPGGTATHGTPMNTEEVTSRMAAFDPKVLDAVLAGIGNKNDQNDPPALRHKRRTEALVASQRLGPGNTALAARLRKLRGTEVEAKMVSPEMLQMAGYDPTAAPTPDAIKNASPLGRRNPTFQRFDRIAARTARAERHSCRYDSPEPDNLIGMAKVAASLFGKPDANDAKAVHDYQQKVYDWARQQYHKGVIAHELGHSMGLRHNFAASFDALNYRPQYWQLRTRNGTVTQDCANGTTDGTNCVGPRWRDPISQEEVDNNLGRFTTSSVMDYPGDQNHDQLLQGKWDRAAMRFGYGNLVDVWAADGVTVDGSGAGKDEAYKLTAFTTSPGLFGIYYFPQSDPTQPYEAIHYSQYQNEFKLIGDCQADSSEGSALGQKCKEQPLDVVDFRDMKDFASDPTYAAFSWAVNAKAVDPKGRVRRGYMFSSDEYADTGNVPSFTYDAGADPYEQIRFLEGGYENRYILDSFRHNRVQFNSWSTTARLQAHYLDTIQLISKSFAFGAVLDGDPAQPSASFLQDGFYGPMAMGSTVALDLFARILTRPEPGLYCSTQNTSCPSYPPYGVDEELFASDSAAVPAAFPGVYKFQLPLGPGRYIHNDYDYAQGYYWSDYQTQVGDYYEKIYATYYLSEAFDSFISNSKEDFTDSRYKNVNFATVYPEQMRRLYSSLFTGDLESYAPWTIVQAGATIPTGEITYPNWHATVPSQVGARPGNAKLIDPDFAFNEQLYAMVWGAMYFPTTWSQSWIDEARLAVYADEAVWPNDQVYAFHDPVSAMTYKAHQVGTETVLGTTRQKGVGARMIQWANRLAALAYVVALDGSGDPRLNSDGSLQYELDANNRPQLNPDNPGADAVLRKYVDNLDLMHQLTAEFNRALDGSDLPQP